MRKVETIFGIDNFMRENFPCDFNQYIGNKNFYELTDKEVKQLKAIKNCQNEDYLQYKDGELFINSKEKIDNVDEDKKEIIDFYKEQLDILSTVQEGLSFAFNNGEIDHEKYLEGMCKTNDRIMTILSQLKIESEYIPF